MREEDKIQCPWCGDEMTPRVEEIQARVGLFKKKHFYTIAMKCQNCGARGPEISCVMNQDEGLLMAARAAQRVIPDWIPHDETGQIRHERLEKMDVEEMEELAHIWHEARHGRTCIYPMAPGSTYWHLQVYGEHNYDENDVYTGQRVHVRAVPRRFRVTASPFGSNDFRTLQEIKDEVEKRWPGMGLAAQIERHIVEMDDGGKKLVDVESDTLCGSTVVPDENSGKLTREDIEGRWVTEEEIKKEEEDKE